MQVEGAVGTKIKVQMVDFVGRCPVNVEINALQLCLDQRLGWRNAVDPCHRWHGCSLAVEDILEIMANAFHVVGEKARSEVGLSAAFQATQVVELASDDVEAPVSLCGAQHVCSKPGCHNFIC